MLSTMDRDDFLSIALIAAIVAVLIVPLFVPLRPSLDSEILRQEHSASER